MAADEQMYALAKFIVGNSCVGSLKLTRFRNPDILRKIVIGPALYLSCKGGQIGTGKCYGGLDGHWENIL